MRHSILNTINDMEAPTVQNIREYISPNSTNFQLVNVSPAITGGRKSFDFSNDYYPKKDFTYTSVNENSSKFNILKNKIDNEMLQYNRYVEIDREKAIQNMYELARKLSDVPFQDVAVEITPSNAVKFKMMLDDRKLLIINKPFEELMDLSNDEVIFSIFINRELIISNAGTTFNVVQAIKNYMSM